MSLSADNELKLVRGGLGTIIKGPDGQQRFLTSVVGESGIIYINGKMPDNDLGERDVLLGKMPADIEKPV